MKTTPSFERYTILKSSGFSVWHNGVIKRVVASAYRFDEDLIICAAHHEGAVMKKQLELIESSTDFNKKEKGFIDQFENFLTEVEAMAIVFCNEQPFDLSKNDDQDRILHSTSIFN